MNKKSEGKIFLESLNIIELKAIAEIIKAESNSKRLTQNSYVETYRKLEEIIEKYAKDWDVSER
ncbi:MAG: hypothetical protein ACRCZO_02905 [Cetobacterium sp.]